MKNLIKTSLLICSLALLTNCGSGGGNNSTPTPTDDTSANAFNCSDVSAKVNYVATVKRNENAPSGQYPLSYYEFLGSLSSMTNNQVNLCQGPSDFNGFEFEDRRQYFLGLYNSGAIDALGFYSNYTLSRYSSCYSWDNQTDIKLAFNPGSPEDATLIFTHQNDVSWCSYASELGYPCKKSFGMSFEINCDQKPATLTSNTANGYTMTLEILDNVNIKTAGTYDAKLSIHNGSGVLQEIFEVELAKELQAAQ